MAMKVGDEIDVDVTEAPVIVGAAGYTCSRCGEFHLALFDEDDNLVGRFTHDDKAWWSLLTYIERALKERFKQ